jgi:hypothetical protein
LDDIQLQRVKPTIRCGSATRQLKQWKRKVWARLLSISQAYTIRQEKVVPKYVRSIIYSGRRWKCVGGRKGSG